MRPPARFLATLLALVLPLSAAHSRDRITQIRIPAWLDPGPALELSGKDFQATIDGVESRVLNVQCPDDGLIILLVLDLSSGDLTLVDPAKETLDAEIRSLHPQTYVGVLRAQDTLQVLTDPTADRDAITALVDAQTLSGHTGLLTTVDTMGRIGDAMLKKSAVRVAILYVTDGEARNYREDFANPVINSSDAHDLSRKFPEALVQEKIAKLDALLAAQQAPLFIVDLNQRNDRLNEAYHNGLKELAETTGGLAFFSRSTTEIPEAVRRGFQSAASHYSLTIEVPEHVSVRPQIRLTMPQSDRSLTYRTRIVLRQR